MLDRYTSASTIRLQSGHTDIRNVGWTAPYCCGWICCACPLPLYSILWYMDGIVDIPGGTGSFSLLYFLRLWDGMDHGMDGMD